MPSYRVHLLAEASQVIEIEDANDVEDAIAQAMDENDLYPNISNRFDMGDPEAYAVYQDDGEEPVWKDGR